MKNDLPIPRYMRDDIDAEMHHDRDGRSDSLPHPIPYPSKSWMMAHRDVIYDTTQNWKRSELLLKLGTIAINYDLAEPLSDTTFGVKVAFNDRYGNPQVWRNLPFIQPDLTPYIEQIAKEISACLSASFVTHSEFNQTVSDLNAKVADAQLSAAQAKAASIEAELCASNAVQIATDAKLCIDVAYDIAAEARLSAGIAIQNAENASQTAVEAKTAADNAILSAIDAKTTADDAKLSADTAMLSAITAYEKADSIQSIALSALDTADTAMGIASRARGDADAAVRLANQAAISAEYAITMPISTDRLVQGEKVNHLECGTSTTILD